MTLPDGVPNVLVGRLDPGTEFNGTRQLRPYYTREEIDRDHALAESPTSWCGRTIPWPCISCIFRAPAG